MSRLHAEVVKAMRVPDVHEKSSAMALESVAGTPVGFKAMVEAELVQWRRVVRQAGIKPEYHFGHAGTVPHPLRRS